VLAKISLEFRDRNWPGEKLFNYPFTKLPIYPMN